MSNEECIRSLEWLDIRQNEIDELLDIVGKLKAENEELRMRLERSVEFPVSKGDKVYYLFRTRRKNEKYGIAEGVVVDYSYNKGNGYIILKCGEHTKTQFTELLGHWWFTTRRAAEKKLKELEEVKK